MFFKFVFVLQVKNYKANLILISGSEEQYSELTFNNESLLMTSFKCPGNTSYLPNSLYANV